MLWDHIPLLSPATTSAFSKPLKCKETQQRTCVNVVKPLLRPPSDVPLAQAGWVELLASIHFLAKVHGLDTPQVRDRLQTEKAHVAGYFDQALRELEKANLM
jgi:hypothetical protein